MDWKLMLFAIALSLAATSVHAQRELTGREAYEPPVRFGLAPGLLGGVDPYGFGVEAGGLVPSLVIGPVWGLKLTQEQERAIDEVYRDHRHQQWAFLHQMNAENARVQQLFGRGKWDVRQVSEAYDRIYTLRRERIEAVARMRNEIVEVLTPEQLKELELLREGKTVPPK